MVKGERKVASGTPVEVGVIECGGVSFGLSQPTSVFERSGETVKSVRE